MALHEQPTVIIQRNRKRLQLPCLHYTCPSKSKEFIDPVYLTQTEWRRIKNSLQKNQTALSELSLVKAEKEQLRLKSKVLKEKWPDNPDYVKKMRFQALQRKMEKEEAVKQKLDQEEAEYQAKKNKMMIERARQLLFDKTEKIQTLNKAFLMASIEKERAVQMQFNKQHRAFEKKLEMDYEKEILNNSLNLKKILEKEQNDVREKAKEFAKHLKTQIKEKEERHEKDKELEKQEYDVTKKLAQFHIDKEEEAQQLIRIRNIKEKQGYIQQIKEKNILKDYLKASEKIDEEKTQLYVEARNEIKYELQKNFDRKKRLNAKMRSTAYLQLEELLKSTKDNQEDIYNKALMEQNAADDRQQQENELKKQKMKQELNDLYADAMEKKQQIKMRLINEDLVSEARDKEDYKRYIEQEKLKKLDKYKIQKEVDETVKQQMEETNFKKEYEKNQEELETPFRNKYFKAYDAEVDAYASKLFQEAKEKNWPMHPLTVAKYVCDWSVNDPFFLLKGQRIPTAFKDKQQNSKSESASRLGFVWP